MRLAVATAGEGARLVTPRGRRRGRCARLEALRGLVTRFTALRRLEPGLAALRGLVTRLRELTLEARFAALGGFVALGRFVPLRGFVTLG